MYKMEPKDMYFFNLRNLQNLRNRIAVSIVEERNSAEFYICLSKMTEASKNFGFVQSIAASERRHTEVLEHMFIEITGEKINLKTNLNENKLTYSSLSFVERLKFALSEKYKTIQNYTDILYSMMDRGYRWNILNIINDELAQLAHLNKLYVDTRLGETKNNSTSNRQLKEFTLEELAKYDGSGGNPAYVAVEGSVYDVSNEASWGGGTHFGLLAGKDFTEEYKSCHKSKAAFEKLPKVGVIKR